MRETDLSNQIKEYLELTGFKVLRLNSGKVKVRGGMMQLCPAGTPDLLAHWFDGQILYVETKTEEKHSKVSSKQIEIHAELRERGFTVIVPKTYIEAVAQITAWRMGIIAKQEQPAAVGDKWEQGELV